MIIVVMGVSGSGKTTVARSLAAALGAAFLEGDELHAPANVEKMRAGHPLSDADRAPWLDAIHTRMLAAHRERRSLVVACSALKQSYRTRLSEGIPVRWIYLKGPPALLRSRIAARTGHFMPADLLDSQLATLEEPRDALTVDVTRDPRTLVDLIVRRLRTP
jgi:gluconokinase